MKNTANNYYVGFDGPIDIGASYGPTYLPGIHTVTLNGKNPLERDNAVNARLEKLRLVQGDNVIVLDMTKVLTKQGYTAILKYEIR